MDGAPPRTPYEQLAQHETLQYKPDRSLADKTGQIEKLTTTTLKIKFGAGKAEPPADSILLTETIFEAV